MRTGTITATVALLLRPGPGPSAGGARPARRRLAGPATGQRRRGAPGLGTVRVRRVRRGLEVGGLRTEPEEQGLRPAPVPQGAALAMPGPGRLQAEEAKSNAGVFVRVDDGILKKVDDKHGPGPPGRPRPAHPRVAAGLPGGVGEGAGAVVRPTTGTRGPDCDAADGKRSRHLAVPTPWPEAAHLPAAVRRRVADDGHHPFRATGCWWTSTASGSPTFDPAGKDVPAAREWYEPSSTEAAGGGVHRAPRPTTPGTWSISRKSASGPCRPAS